MNEHAPYLSSTLAFLAGALAGASAALLLAPQSGPDTRDMMRRKLDETTSSVRELRNRLVQRGEEVKEEATHRVSGAASALAGRGAGAV